MKNIRLNVFETNSSSTHSISISSLSNGVYDTLPVDDGRVVLSGGEFGWEWEKYNDALTKANYAAVFAFQSRDGNLVEMLIDVLKKHTGAKEVEFNFSSEYSDRNGRPWAYIDHQSGPGEGGDGKRAFESSQTLKEFIFNPGSWLFTGNDNEPAKPNFYDVGDVKYTHLLELDGLKQYLKVYPSKDELKDILSELVQHHPCTQYNYNNYDNCYNLSCYSGETGPDDSFAEMDKNVLIVFKTKHNYDTGDEYIGKEVIDTKKLKFKITPV